MNAKSTAMTKTLPKLDFQEIARPGTFDVHRTGEWVGNFGVEVDQVGDCHAGLDLTIRGIACFQDDLLARIDL